MIGLVAIVVLYAVTLVAVPAIPRLHHFRGGLRLYDCQFPGGSIPPEFPAMADVRRGVQVRDLRAVADGDQVLFAAEVRSPAGGELGTARWRANGPMSSPLPPVVPIDQVANDVAAQPVADTAPGSWAADAAAACHRP